MSEPQVWLLCRASKAEPVVAHSERVCPDPNVLIHVAVIEKPYYDRLRERLAEAEGMLSDYVNGFPLEDERVRAFLAGAEKP